jgi:restriction system protein
VLWVLVGIALVLGVIHFLLVHWWLLVLLLVASAGAGATYLYRRAESAKWERVRINGLRFQLAHIDNMGYDPFEFAVRDLMRRDGCPKAEKIGGRGDNGCDVLADDPWGRRWVLQCKHRKHGLAGSAVGVQDVQIVNGTARQLYSADVVVMVTNGRYTGPALQMGKTQRIHLVDRRVLGEWATGSRPLWELLRIPPPRKPSALS